MSRRLLLTVLVTALAAHVPSAAPQTGPGETDPDVTFGEEITVELATVVVRVVDPEGDPVLGLGPDDFRVRIGPAETPVVAVDWISSGGVEESDLESIETLDDILALDAGTDSKVPERYLVFFVQRDFNPERRKGHRHVLPDAQEIPRTLHPEDWAAVVIFDAHLKLRQDFTRERAPIEDALGESIYFGGESGSAVRSARRAGRGPSLARHLDFDAARRATSPERGLELTARAMAAFPGQKVLIYLGWGLGEFKGRQGVQMTHDYQPALDALAAADATVFVLDTSYADFHSLEIGLQQIAEDTGGLYVRGFRHPRGAAQRLARSISGYYLLTVDRSGIPAADAGGTPERLRVGLVGARGRVLARPRMLAAGPG